MSSPDDKTVNTENGVKPVLARRLAGLAAQRRNVSVTALLASVILFALAVLLFRVVGVTSHTVTREALRSSRNPRAQQVLTRELETVGGTHCHTETYEVTRAAFWVAPARAIAYAGCGANGSGVQSLGGYAFRTRGDLETWIAVYNDYRRSLPQPGVCEGGSGWSEWADSSDTVRGQMVCYVGQDGGAAIAWANLEKRVGFVAYSKQNSLASVFDWWEEHARGRVRATQGMQALNRLYSKYVRGGLSGCRRGRSPLANYVLWCQEVHPNDDPGAKADTMNLYYFATPKQLDAFYAAYTSEFEAPESAGGLECGRAAFVATTYGEPTEGRCFDFATNEGEVGALWLLWTHDHQRVAALISGSDEDLDKLARVWNAVY